MFSQPSDESQSSRKRNRLRRKNRNKKFLNKVLSRKESDRLTVVMSSWAENFTVAATWQLKHQIAYWKSKAMALEYENRILHDIIKKKYVKYVEPERSNNEETTLESDSEEIDEQLRDEDDENIEVSEEYIQFLVDNAKYKEDARQEREKLKAKMNLEENETAVLEAGPSNLKENTSDVNKELYGKNWKRISALETSMLSNFISKSDQLQPMYWPNIPFNFNFS